LPAPYATAVQVPAGKSPPADQLIPPFVEYAVLPLDAIAIHRPLVLYIPYATSTVAPDNAAGNAPPAAQVIPPSAEYALTVVLPETATM
jgi:hypothetical protein